MSYARRDSVAVTTADDGSATAYSENLTGRIINIRYVKDDFDDGSTFTITNETTGETIWSESAVNASATRAPRQATHATDGSASLFAAAGEPVEDHIVLANDRVKIVIAAGGKAKGGTFHVLVG